MKKLAPLLLLLFLLGTHSSDLNIEEDWVEPNAWGRAEHAGLNLGGALLDKLDKGVAAYAAATKETCASAEDALALIYYKKFIATLFNRNKLQYNEASALYQRALLFTIQAEQLTQLEQLSDPRDLDAILTNIIANARPPPLAKAASGKSTWSNVALIWDIFKDLAQLLRNSEVRFLLLSLSAVLLCWFLHRRYRISLILLIVGGVLLIGYFMTYLECNRKLEMEEMLDVLEEKSPTHVASSWHSPLTKWFYTPEPLKQQRLAKIKKHSKINLGFCRPDHVLLMYMNGLFMKQLEYLLEKCTETLVTLKDGLSFPYNFIAGGMLLLMIAYIVKLTFKYILSPSAWAGLLHRPAATNTHYQQQHSPPAALPNVGVAAIGGGEDRISGENLKIILNALTMPVVSANPPLQAVSGVQEVLEQLEAAGTASSSPTSSLRSSKSNSPNTSLDEQQQTTPSINNNNTSFKEDAAKDAKA